MEADIGPNWYALVIGIPRPAHPVAFAPGLTLRPLPHRLGMFDAIGAAASGFQAASSLSDIVGAAMCEFESAADSSPPPGFDPLNRIWLASTLLLLRGHWRVLCPAAISVSWSTLTTAEGRSWETQPPPFQLKVATGLSIHGTILDLHFRMIVPNLQRTSSFTEESAQWVKSAFPTANRLCSESAQFRFALEAASDWRFSPDARAGLSRLWAGIEAILGISVEITYRTALVCAALLEPYGEKRHEVYNRVKSLYGKRSKAVHGDKITDEALGEAISGSFELLVRLLECCLERDGVPDQKAQEEALLGPSTSSGS